MNKKILLLGSAVTVVALGVGTTFALFSASATSNNNFTAGKLCITADRNDGDPVPGPMFYITPAQGQTPGGILGTLPTGLWAPGDTNTRTLTVTNPTSCSTMDAWLTSVQATMHPGGYLPMADKLWVKVYTPQGGGPDVLVAQGPMSTFLAGPVPIQYPDTSKIPLYLSSNRHMKFEVHFDINADNSYQDKTLVVDFTVNSVQMPHNP
jgi:predicted ribosomally synthesized peptide with SipW-like signal peptide